MAVSRVNQFRDTQNYTKQTDRTEEGVVSCHFCVFRDLGSIERVVAILVLPRLASRLGWLRTRDLRNLYFLNQRRAFPFRRHSTFALS
jgi:hypothetical protein